MSTTIGERYGAETGKGPGNRWVNWHGNVTCTPEAFATPENDEDVQALVREARTAGSPIRVSGSGHSCTPLNATNGILVHLDKMRGLVGTDAARGEFTARAGTQIFELGDPLWDAGLSLLNQGDIDVQTVAGATGTGTHGSGIELSSLSGAVRGVRLVNGLGEIVDIDDSQPELLDAVRVSMGMLGVVTQVTMAAAPAYYLKEQVEYPQLENVLNEWDEYLAKYRHFSFFWSPDRETADSLNLGYPSDVDVPSSAKVKLYESLPADATVNIGGPYGSRLDRGYRIYPEHYDRTFVEMEYMVPLDRGKEALDAIRGMIAEQFPEDPSALEVRFTAGDNGYLSPSHGGPTLVLACAEKPDEKDFKFMHAFEDTLVPLGGRPHWGKLHFLTKSQVQAMYPRYDDFVAVRRQFDPDGIFLNDHLRSLFE